MKKRKPEMNFAGTPADTKKRDLIPPALGSVADVFPEYPRGAAQDAVARFMQNGVRASVAAMESTALEGVGVDVYPGKRPGRAAAIEAARSGKVDLGPRDGTHVVHEDPIPPDPAPEPALGFLLPGPDLDLVKLAMDAQRRLTVAIERRRRARRMYLKSEEAVTAARRQVRMMLKATGG